MSVIEKINAELDRLQKRADLFDEKSFVSKLSTGGGGKKPPAPPRRRGGGDEEPPEFNSYGPHNSRMVAYHKDHATLHENLEHKKAARKAASKKEPRSMSDLLDRLNEEITALEKRVDGDVVNFPGPRTIPAEQGWGTKKYHAEAAADHWKKMQASDKAKKWHQEKNLRQPGAANQDSSAAEDAYSKVSVLHHTLHSAHKAISGHLSAGGKVTDEAVKHHVTAIRGLSKPLEDVSSKLSKSHPVGEPHKVATRDEKLTARSKAASDHHRLLASGLKHQIDYSTKNPGYRDHRTVFRMKTAMAEHLRAAEAHEKGSSDAAALSKRANKAHNDIRWSKD